MGNLIKYDDFGEKIGDYTNYVVWEGSKEQKINRWLNPIYHWAKEESVFYSNSSERDCGWYNEKGSILKILQDTLPDTEWEEDFKLILSELQDYIIGYKEPKI